LLLEALSKDELISVLRIAREHSERNYLMFLMAYTHGLRASEVVALTRDNVRDGHLTVARLKGSLKTRQPLLADDEPLLNEVFAFSAFRPESKRLFPITRQHFWRLFQRYAAAAGIPQDKRYPHILKKSIGMHHIHSAGIENVRQHLGHKSMASTGEYLKVDDDEASAAILKGKKKK
jgi:integrase